MKEIFTLSYIEEINNFKLQVNKDFLKKYGVTNQMFKENFNYELVDKLKDHIVDIIKEGVLTMKNSKVEDNNSNFILEHHVY
ncbi:hypothetical protein G6Z34_13640 [Clostridium perfringens]|uniref:Uncharacterized protein n=1 Tax=Clostridium perfringens TaxID=1502 RepID=A0AAP6WSC1_CLOPF|nr:hypothetical protein [Clostridium perfringens]NGU31129.1 hypothetical protein [Clostridium perfringens]